MTSTDQLTLGQQAPIAVAAVFIIDWLKRANWFPWINQNSEKLNRVVSLAIAFCTAAGLKIASGDSVHGWMIAVPPLSDLIDTLLHAITQFGGQELLHKLLGNHQIGKESAQKLAEIANLLAQLKAQGEVKK